MSSFVLLSGHTSNLPASRLQELRGRQDASEAVVQLVQGPEQVQRQRALAHLGPVLQASLRLCRHVRDPCSVGQPQRVRSRRRVARCRLHEQRRLRSYEFPGSDRGRLQVRSRKRRYRRNERTLCLSVLTLFLSAVSLTTSSTAIRHKLAETHVSAPRLRPRPLRRAQRLILKVPPFASLVLVESARLPEATR